MQFCVSLQHLLTYNFNRYFINAINFDLPIYINQMVILIPLMDEKSEVQKGQQIYPDISYKEENLEFMPQFYLNAKPVLFPLTLLTLAKATPQVQMFSQRTV